MIECDLDTEHSILHVQPKSALAPACRAKLDVSQFDIEDMGIHQFIPWTMRGRIGERDDTLAGQVPSISKLGSQPPCRVLKRALADDPIASSGENPLGHRKLLVSDSGPSGIGHERLL